MQANHDTKWLIISREKGSALNANREIYCKDEDSGARVVLAIRFFANKPKKQATDISQYWLNAIKENNTLPSFNALSFTGHTLTWSFEALDELSKAWCISHKIRCAIDLHKWLLRLVKDHTVLLPYQSIFESESSLSDWQLADPDLPATKMQSFSSIFMRILSSFSYGYYPQSIEPRLYNHSDESVKSAFVFPGMTALTRYLTNIKIKADIMRHPYFVCEVDAFDAAIDELQALSQAFNKLMSNSFNDITLVMIVKQLPSETALKTLHQKMVDYCKQSQLVHVLRVAVLVDKNIKLHAQFELPPLAIQPVQRDDTVIGYQIASIAVNLAVARNRQLALATTEVLGHATEPKAKSKSYQPHTFQAPTQTTRPSKQGITQQAKLSYSVQLEQTQNNTQQQMVVQQQVQQHNQMNTLDNSNFDPLAGTNYFMSCENYFKNIVKYSPNKWRRRQDQLRYTQRYMMQHPDTFEDRVRKKPLMVYNILANVCGYACIVNEPSQTFHLIPLAKYYSYYEDTSHSAYYRHQSLLHHGIPNSERKILKPWGTIRWHDSSTRTNPLFHWTMEGMQQEEWDSKTFSYLHNPPGHAILLAEADAKNEVLIEKAQRLMTLFNPELQVENDITNLTKDLLETLPLSVQPNIAKLIKHFQTPHIDFLKIILHIQITEGLSGLTQLSKLIDYCAERDLLHYFYLYYFEYARDFASLSELTRQDKYAFFLEQAKLIPAHVSEQQWPLAARFNLHIALYFAQNYQQMNQPLAEHTQTVWLRLEHKITSYVGNNPQQAKHLLKQLVNTISTEDGLAFDDYFDPYGFLESLELVIDNAIKHHCLAEQIAALANISLRPLDVPYAVIHNDYQVVCQEMQLQSTEILISQGDRTNLTTFSHDLEMPYKEYFKNRGDTLKALETAPEKLLETTEMLSSVFSNISKLKKIKPKDYRVDQSKLAMMIAEHEQDSPYLKIAAFRFLGSKRLRKPIQFYQDLAKQYCTKPLHEILFAFYVYQYTGDNVFNCFDAKTFIKSFERFKENYTWHVTFSDPDIEAAITALQNTLSNLEASQPTHNPCLKELLLKHDASLNKTPDFFLRRFDKTQLSDFLKQQATALQDAVKQISDPDHKIIEAFIDLLGETYQLNAKESKLLKALLSITGNLNLKTFADDVADYINYIESYCKFIKMVRTPATLRLLSTLFKGKDLLSAQALLASFVDQLSLQPHNQKQNNLFHCYLQLLNYNQKIFEPIADEQTLIFCSITLEAMLASEDECSAETIFYVALNIWQADFPVNERLAIQRSMLKLLQADPKLALICISLSSADLQAIHSLMQKDKAQASIVALLKHINVVAEENRSCLIAQLATLNDLTLNGLSHLVSIHQLSTTDFQAILSGTMQLEDARTTHYAKNIDAYQFDAELVKSQIAKITLKLPDQDKSLNASLQDKLFADFSFVMAIMTNNSVTVDNEIENFTIKSLVDENIPAVIAILRQTIANDPEQAHRAKLIVLAIAIDVMFRQGGKTPRYTQILTAISSLHFDFNRISEIRTGEGKTIIDYLEAVLLYSAGNSPVICSHDTTLANDGMQAMAACFNSLGICYNPEVILANSALSCYVKGGVNFSTYNDLALFDCRANLNGLSFIEGRALIADEIDAALKSEVPSRLAGAFLPIAHQLDHWQMLYEHIIDFTDDDNEFKSKICHPDEDVANLHQYLLAQESSPAYHEFLKQIPNSTLDELIESTMTAKALVERIDFLAVAKTIRGESAMYAAPLLAHTSRAAPEVSLSKGGQQCLQVLMNRRYPKSACRFHIDVLTDTLLVVNMKSFFDSHRLRGCKIIGLTGTGGDQNERAEFYKDQNLVVVNYPSYYKDNRVKLTNHYAFGQQAHFQLLAEKIVSVRGHTDYTQQAIIIFMQSPKHSRNFYLFLKKFKTDLDMQVFNGFDEYTHQEAQVLARAGRAGMITITNGSIERGANVIPELAKMPAGTMIINADHAITESNLIQRFGRCGRNSAPGCYFSCVNAESFAQPSADPATLDEKFADYRKKLSAQQSTTRRSEFLLGEARHVFIQQYMFDYMQSLKVHLDPILGTDFVLIDQAKLMQQLHQFNIEIETAYDTLQAMSDLDPVEFREKFITEAHSLFEKHIQQLMQFAQYETIPMHFLPVAIADIQAVAEPLADVPIVALRSFASMGHYCWLRLGHQNINDAIKCAEDNEDFVVPYIKGQKSLLKTIGDALYKRDKISASSVVNARSILLEGVDYVESNIDKFPPILNKIKHLLSFPEIKDGIKTYCDELSTIVSKCAWDDLRFPNLKFSFLDKLIKFFSRLGYIKEAILITAGAPAYITRQLVSKLVMPTLMKGIKLLLKKIFANSDNIYVQAVNLLDQFYSEIECVITKIYELKQQADATNRPPINTAGDLLDLFTSLLLKIHQQKDTVAKLIERFYLDNPSNLALFNQFFQFVDLIPESLAILEKYRDQPISRLLKGKPIIEMLQLFCHSEAFEKLMPENDLDQHRFFIDIDQATLDKLDEIALPDLIRLITGLAHPEFFSFMQALDNNETLAGALAHYDHATRTTAEPASDPASQAAAKLAQYQREHDSLGTRTQQAVAKLRRTYQVSLASFKLRLNNMQAKEPDLSTVIDMPEPTPTKARWFHIKWQTALKFSILAGLIAYTAVHFSIPLAIACGIYGVQCLYSSVKPYLQRKTAKPVISSTHKINQTLGETKLDGSRSSLRETGMTMRDVTPAPSVVIPAKAGIHFYGPRSSLRETGVTGLRFAKPG